MKSILLCFTTLMLLYAIAVSSVSSSSDSIVSYITHNNIMGKANIIFIRLDNNLWTAEHLSKKIISFDKNGDTTPTMLNSLKMVNQIRNLNDNYSVYTHELSNGLYFIDIYDHKRKLLTTKKIDST